MLHPSHDTILLCSPLQHDSLASDGTLTERSPGLGHQGSFLNSEVHLFNGSLHFSAPHLLSDKMKDTALSFHILFEKTERLISYIWNGS